MLRIAIVLIALAPSIAIAQQQIRTSSDGVAYRVDYNQHGAVLTGGGETIYLGRTCDALSGDQLGAWAWANGGFVIELPGRALGFPRQEIAIQDDGRCWMQ
ncbi:hypothetical protein [Rhodophyticola sp.]|jgi:hypothetical protein|uniref:hypothetical protein n=1 Tax=Rhodophyticola sp. TaxID=2680032 RepID=UPI001B0E2929|nr:hypothetical protein [Roseicyclus sp.]MBO6626705.1 hypothetical protein [Roseicyclus sp.]MBO6922369.1 hypothetical protein [Roseicyclus sp.]